MMTLEDMVPQLRDGLCEVIFNKKNGDERVMTCTLANDLIPEEHTPKGTSAKVPSTETLAVFDVNAEGWRSFRLENVTNFKYI